MNSSIQSFSSASFTDIKIESSHSSETSTEQEKREWDDLFPFIEEVTQESNQKLKRKIIKKEKLINKKSCSSPSTDSEISTIDDLIKCQKAQERKDKNRLSAQRYRQHKKSYHNRLEEHLKSMVHLSQEIEKAIPPFQFSSSILSFDDRIQINASHQIPPSNQQSVITLTNTVEQHITEIFQAMVQELTQSQDKIKKLESENAKLQRLQQANL